MGVCPHRWERKIPICSTYSGKTFETIPSPNFVPTPLPEPLTDAVPWCLKSRNTTDVVIAWASSIMKNVSCGTPCKSFVTVTVGWRFHVRKLLPSVYWQLHVTKFLAVTCFAKTDSYMSRFAKFAQAACLTVTCQIFSKQRSERWQSTIYLLLTFTPYNDRYSDTCQY